MRRALALLLLAPALHAEPPAVLAPDPDRTRQVARDAAALFGHAVLLQRADRLIEARAALENVVRLDPDAIPPRRRLVPLYVALHRPDAALAAARRVTDLAPADADGWLLLAELDLDLRFPQDAAAALDRAATLTPLDAPRFVALARRAVERLEPTAATAAFAAAAAEVAAQYRAVLTDVPPFDPAAVAAAEGDLWEAAGVGHTAASQWAAADAALDRAAAFRSDDVARARLLRNRAALAVARGKYDDAQTLIDRSIVTHRRDGAAYALKLRILKAGNPRGDALRALERDLQQADRFAPLMLLIAEEQRGRGAANEGLLTQAVTFDPTADGYRALFRFYLDRRQPEAAVRLLNERLSAAEEKAATPDSRKHARAIRQAFAADPGLVDQLMSHAERTARATVGTLHYLAQAGRRAGRLDGAAALARAALQAARHPDAQQHLGSLYVELLGAEYDAGNFDQVVATCERGLNDPRSQGVFRTVFHHYAALAYAHLRNPGQALEHANEAVRISGESDKLRAEVSRADVLLHLGRYAEAERSLLELLPAAKAEDESRARLALARALTAGKQFGRAEGQLRRLIDAQPENPTAHNDLGYHLAEQGRSLDEAERLVRRALELNRLQRRAAPPVDDDDTADDPEEDVAAYLDSLGWVLFRQGKLADAVTTLERAVGLPEGGRDAVVWDHLGDALFALGQKPGAGRAWAKAEELYARDRRVHNDVRAADVAKKRRLVP